MLLGELPTEEDVHEITANWQRRSHVPNMYLPPSKHCRKIRIPMTQFVVCDHGFADGKQVAEKYAKG